MRQYLCGDTRRCTDARLWNSFIECSDLLICFVSRCVCVSSPLGAVTIAMAVVVDDKLSEAWIGECPRTVCPDFVRPTHPPTRKSLGVREQAGGCELLCACSPVLCFGRVWRFAPTFFPYAIHDYLLIDRQRASPEASG